MGQLEDTVAVITGAGSGIGAAVTRRFVEEGARVVAFDRSPERLTALAEELGNAVATVAGDVRNLADNRKAVQTAVQRFGRLDVFVGNAGIWDGASKVSELADDMLASSFTEIFDVNVRGYVNGAKAAIPELRRTNGNIVLTLSTSSFYLGGGGPLYVASKHAALGLMRGLAHELAPDIRVNGVAPSFAPTSLANATGLGSPPRPADGRLTNLLRVDVEAADHAGAYVFLACRRSRMMTGAVINSDGGRGVAAARMS
jgi:NAD(P)-dependent dehydrogenase (short-subunit alcohol dehydrogenase family)